MVTWQNSHTHCECRNSGFYTDISHSPRFFLHLPKNSCAPLFLVPTHTLSGMPKCNCRFVLLLLLFWYADSCVMRVSMPQLHVYMLIHVTSCNQLATTRVKGECGIAGFYILREHTFFARAGRWEGIEHRSNASFRSVPITNDPETLRLDALSACWRALGS